MRDEEVIRQLRSYLDLTIAKLKDAPWDDLIASETEPVADVLGKMSDGSDCQFEAELLERENEHGIETLRLAVTVTGAGESLGTDLFARENGERFVGGICRFVNGVAIPFAE